MSSGGRIVSYVREIAISCCQQISAISIDRRLSFPPPPLAATLDFNAVVFLRVIVAAVAVSAVVASLFFAILRRFGAYSCDIFERVAPL